MNSSRWSNTTKIVVTAAIGLLGLLLLIAFRAMIAPTIVAFLVTFILHRPVSWLQRRTGWSRGASVLLIYLVSAALLALAPVLIIPRLTSTVVSLQVALQDLIVDLQTAAPGQRLPFLENVPLDVSGLFQQLGAALDTLFSSAATGALVVARNLTTGILSSVYVIVLSFWLLKDIYKLQRFVLERVIPSDYSEEMRLLGRELAEIWYAFLRGQFVLGVVIGTITWIAMSIVGLPNAAGLALLAGVMEFLPTVGPGISGAIGTTVALFRGSTWLPINNLAFALVVLALYVIITQIESVYLIPRLVGRRVRLHPGITFAGIINGAIVFGVLGVLLATPTIASARTIFSYLYRKLRDLEPFESDRRAQTGVRIRGLIAGHRIEGLIFDLDGVLAKPDLGFADWVAQRTAWLAPLLDCQQRQQIGRRFMVALEGPINRWVSLLLWLQLHKDLARMLPHLNWLRGFTPAPAMQPVEDVPELMASLSMQYRLAIITTRRREEVEKFFRQYQLPAYHFDVLVALGDVRHPPPHSDATRTARETLQLEPGQVMVVSDTALNLRAAQAQGMVTCGVLCGLGNDRDLAEADLVLEKTVQLAEWL